MAHFHLHVELKLNSISFTIRLSEVNDAMSRVMLIVQCTASKTTDEVGSSLVTLY